jgi:glutamate-1-semialdehyde aminotransferase
VYGHGYHGFGNAFVSAEVPGLGCVDEGYVKFQTMESLRDMLLVDSPDVAAVIVEPVVADLSVKDIMTEIRALCKKQGILFIADEIVSGGRTLEYCFSNYWQLDPDIICLGKALGGGKPLGIVGVRDKCLVHGVFISTTFSGEISAIQESIALLKWLTPDKIQDLWESGSAVINGLNGITEKYGIDLRLQGYPTRAVWQGGDMVKSIFWEQMLKCGHLCGAAWFITFSHNATVITKFLKDADVVCQGILQGGYALKGAMPKPVFKRT